MYKVVEDYLDADMGGPIFLLIGAEVSERMSRQCVQVKVLKKPQCGHQAPAKTSDHVDYIPLCLHTMKNSVVWTDYPLCPLTSLSAQEPFDRHRHQR